MLEVSNGIQSSFKNLHFGSTLIWDALLIPLTMALTF